jgi:hypothetical protein
VTSQYIYLILFAFAAYLICTDQSAAKAFLFVINLIKFQYEKYKWIVIHHPKTPWARYSMHRRSMKLAKELMKELEENQNV